MAEPTLLPERLQYRPTKIELDESIEKAKATLLKKIKRSVYVYRVDCGGCNGCEIEIFGSITPVFDVERFGIKVVPSPRHADVLLYTGAVTRAMRMPALRAFEAAPDPKIVVSYGACGCTGGIFYDNYCVWGGTDKILPVDVYIPGCPPSPAQTVYGFAMALGLLDQKLHAETTVEAAGEQADILHPVYKRLCRLLDDGVHAKSSSNWLVQRTTWSELMGPWPREPVNGVGTMSWWVTGRYWVPL